MDLISELESALHAMVGKQCWSYAASINTGSHVSFDIGRKVRRKKPLRNPRISEEERLYQGEFDLYVTCSWRLDWKGEVLCGGEDDNSKDGPMQHGLRYLLDQRVISAELEPPGLDLLLAFEDDLVLRIFCDELGGEEDAGNYALFLPSHYLSVRGRSKVVKHSELTDSETLDFRLMGSSSEEEKLTAKAPPSAETWKAPADKAPEISSLVGGTCEGFEISGEERSPVHLSIRPPAAEAVDLVIGCSWRLDSPSEVLCGIGSSREEMGEGLQKIVGQAIRAIDVSPGLDLRVHFENGLKLSVFCDHVNEVSLWDNYLIEEPGGSFIVGTCGVVRRE